MRVTTPQKSGAEGLFRERSARRRISGQNSETAFLCAALSAKAALHRVLVVVPGADLRAINEKSIIDNS